MLSCMGGKIVFRNHTTDQGDFCIFIYKKFETLLHCSTGNHYKVGYDGSYNIEESDPTSFMSCVRAAYQYIDFIF